MNKGPVYNANTMQYCYPESPAAFKLAHAYVPFQCLTCVFPPMKGLKKGTIFPELYRPYGTDPEYLVDA